MAAAGWLPGLLGRRQLRGHRLRHALVIFLQFANEGLWPRLQALSARAGRAGRCRCRAAGAVAQAARGE
jgi:hypothetical protein